MNRVPTRSFNRDFDVKKFTRLLCYGKFCRVYVVVYQYTANSKKVGPRKFKTSKFQNKKYNIKIHCDGLYKSV